MARNTIAILLVLISFGFSNPAYALSEEYRVTLKGLKGVYVWVNKLTAVADGSFQSSIQDSFLLTEVELALRKAGIKVLSEKQWRETPGRPSLNVYFSPDTGTLTVSLNQDVIMARQPKIKSHQDTWRISVNSQPPLDDSYLSQFLNEFINDFLAANQ